jgi:hypothetical protein
MAELDVQPKRPKPWWLWLIIGLVALTVFIFISRGCHSKTTPASNADSTKTAATSPGDWENVDFNESKLSALGISHPTIFENGNDQNTNYAFAENRLFGTQKTSPRGKAVDKRKKITRSLIKHCQGAGTGAYGNIVSLGRLCTIKFLTLNGRRS